MRILFRVGGRVPEGSKSALLFPHPPHPWRRAILARQKPVYLQREVDGVLQECGATFYPPASRKETHTHCTAVRARMGSVVCTWSVSARYVRTTDGTRGVARPISNIDGFVKHVYREHDQEDDHWANIGAQRRRK